MAHSKSSAFDTPLRRDGSLAVVRRVLADWGPPETELFEQLDPAQVTAHLTRQIRTLRTVDVLSEAERDQLLMQLAPATAATTGPDLFAPGASCFEILSGLLPQSSVGGDPVLVLIVAAAAALGAMIAGSPGAALGAELALSAWPDWARTPSLQT